MLRRNEKSKWLEQKQAQKLLVGWTFFFKLVLVEFYEHKREKGEGGER